MALQWQNVHVDFDEGIDTKTDPKGVVATKLLQAQNVVFTSPKALRSRNGYSIIASTFDTSADVATGLTSRLMAHGEELVLLDSTNLRSPNSLGASVPREARLTGTAGIGRTAVARYADKIAKASDVAIVGNVCVTVAQMQSNSPYAAIANEIVVVVSLVDTGEIISRTKPYAANAKCPRAVAVGSFVWVFYLDIATGNLRGTRFNTATMSFDLPDGLRLAGVTGIYDVAPLNTATAFLLLAPIGANLTLYILNTALAGSNVAVASVSTGPCAVLGVAFDWHQIAWRDDGSSNLLFKGFDGGLVSLFPAVTPRAAWPAGNQVVLGRLSATVDVCAWDELFVGKPVVSHTTVSKTGVVSPAVPFTQYNRSLESKPWIAGDSARVLVGVNDPVQGTVFIENLSFPTFPLPGPVGNQGAQTDARIARGTSGTGVNAFSLPKVQVTATPGLFLTGLLTKQKIVFGFNSTSIEQVGVDHLRINHAFKPRYCTAELGGITYIAGGQLLCYDGAVVFEAGFGYFPAVPTVALNAGGAVTAGVHQYLAVYEYTDAAGNVHRSAPSLAVTSTIVAGTQQVFLFTNNLNFSQRDIVDTSPANVPRIAIVPYGTQAGSSAPFKRLKSTGRSRWNEPANNALLSNSLDPITEDDATIGAYPNLYTSGDVLPNYPPPSTDVIAVHQNRLWVVSSEDGTIWPSKEYVVGEAPGWNDALAFALPTSDIPTALRSFDDKLIAWTRTGIYVITGSPGNDQGQGRSLDAQKLQSDVGAIDWRSVVTTTQGAFFLSTKGIYLLTPGLEVIYVGADVERWTNLYPEVNSALVTPDRTEVRFNLAGQTLVLNFRAIGQNSPYGKWSTFDWGNPEAHPTITSMVTVGSSVYLAGVNDAGGFVARETGFPDGPSAIRMIVETANIYPFGSQALIRCRTATFRGQNLSAHGFTLKVAYQADAAYTESVTWTGAQIAALSREQFSHHLVQQKGSCVRLLLQNEPFGAPGEALSFSGIVLECAQKRGSIDRTLPPEARQ